MNIVWCIITIAIFVIACNGPARISGGSTSTENAQVRGVVVASAGTPVSRAAVRIRHADYLSDGSTVARDDVFTDDAGRFSIDSVAPGNYLIEVADNQGNAVAVPCSVDNERTIELGTRTVVPMGLIEGSAGGPAVAAHLRIRGLERYVTTDSIGRFSTPVPSGRQYSVNITTPDTSIDLPPTDPVEPSRIVTITADLGNFSSDSIAVRVFLNSLGMAAVPLDSVVRFASDGRMRALVLRNRNLAALPAAIGNLAFLWEIDLGENPLGGLPESLDRLPRLSHLFLDGTTLAGLPEVVCRCTTLKWLKLGNGSIRTLPPQLASLAALSVLDISGMELETVPPVVCSLTALTELSLAGNRLSALPESIERCRNLEVLHLDDNDLESLPDAITRLSGLTTLYVYRNNLTFLPDSIGRLRMLTRIELQENRLTTLPLSIGSCTAMRYLNLWGNDLADLPASMANMQPTDGLTLGGNRLCKLAPAITAWADTFAETGWAAQQTCQ